MSSRFVPAGTDTSSSVQKDDWAKARQEVQERRDAKPVEQGKQDNGQSLYEVLQANKAAKQEAFEESTKLRNQFRPLDESEIEFLDSIRELERTKDDRIKQETAQQLELFKKQRDAAEQTASSTDDTSSTSKQDASQEPWRVVKKRRRDKTDDGVDTNKLKKPSNPSRAELMPASTLPAGEGGSKIPVVEVKQGVSPSGITAQNGENKNKPVPLSLVAYDPEEED